MKYSGLEWKDAQRLSSLNIFFYSKDIKGCWWERCWKSHIYKICHRLTKICCVSLKNDDENLIIAFLLDMAQFGRVFWSLQNHRVKLKSTFHGESLKCWMVSKFLLGEIEIWELSLALQISANQQALQTVSGTVKKRKKEKKVTLKE